MPDVTDSDAYGIWLPNSAVNIMLKGTNVVRVGDASESTSYGVYGDDDSNISISGGGALYTLADSATSISSSLYGYSIRVSDDATVTVKTIGVLTATGGMVGGMTLRLRAAVTRTSAPIGAMTHQMIWMVLACMNSKTLRLDFTFSIA